jgi:hypothetical protein
MHRACCTLAIVFSLLWSPLPAVAVGPGDRAPDFTLQDLNGGSFRLSEHAGEVVLLAFIGYG